MPKIFSFIHKRTQGRRGEADFLTFYPAAQKSPDLVYDFILDGQKIELKTEFRTLAQTPNFFMERYGNLEKLSPGGVWKSANKNIKWYVVYFIYDKTFFWFRAKLLKAFLDKFIKGEKPKYIDNKTYKTVGYIIPREKVLTICEKIDRF